MSTPEEDKQLNINILTWKMCWRVKSSVLWEHMEKLPPVI